MPNGPKGTVREGCTRMSPKHTHTEQELSHYGYHHPILIQSLLPPSLCPLSPLPPLLGFNPATGTSWDWRRERGSCSHHALQKEAGRSVEQPTSSGVDEAGRRTDWWWMLRCTVGEGRPALPPFCIQAAPSFRVSPKKTPQKSGCVEACMQTGGCWVDLKGQSWGCGGRGGAERGVNKVDRTVASRWQWCLSVQHVMHKGRNPHIHRHTLVSDSVLDLFIQKYHKVTVLLVIKGLLCSYCQSHFQCWNVSSYFKNVLLSQHSVMSQHGLITKDNRVQVFTGHSWDEREMNAGFNWH